MPRLARPAFFTPHIPGDLGKLTAMNCRYSAGPQNSLPKPPGLQQPQNLRYSCLGHSGARGPQSGCKEQQHYVVETDEQLVPCSAKWQNYELNRRSFHCEMVAAISSQMFRTCFLVFVGKQGGIEALGRTVFGLREQTALQLRKFRGSV